MFGQARAGIAGELICTQVYTKLIANVKTRDCAP
jgi:hypothetical protein